MEKKYFGIKNSVIDPYFEETKRISDLVYDNKDSILYNVLNPEKIETSDNTEIYYAKKLILPSGIEISVDALYNNGVVYNISNEKMSENSDIPHTEAKLIVGNNMINLFINYIDDRYNNNSFLLKDLEKNIEKEKNKNNNKNKAPNIQINTNTSNDNDIEKNPLFHSSKSETLPNLIFQNIFGNILGVPELGDKGRSKFHEHTLVYSSYDMKSPEYAKGPYYCDHCQGEFPKQVKNFYCKSCGFDLCERCYKLSKC